MQIDLQTVLVGGLGVALALVYVGAWLMILVEWFALLVESHIKHGLMGTCLFFVPPVFLWVYWKDAELRNSALRLLTYVAGLVAFAFLVDFLAESFSFP